MAACLEDQLEPRVDGTDYHMSGETAIKLSIAISLKRIADTLEKARGIDFVSAGQDFGGGIETIAYSIGQQIRRGMEAG